MAQGLCGLGVGAKGREGASAGRSSDAEPVSFADGLGGVRDVRGGAGRWL